MPLTTAATISFSARVSSPGAIARFIARPWKPPSSGSHAITRLIAGGCAKSYLNQALATSKSFRVDSGYSSASLSLTVGIARSSVDRCASAGGAPAPRRPAAHTASQVRRGRAGRGVDQPSPGPSVDRAVGADRPGADQALHRPRHLVGAKAEEACELLLGREHRAARVALDQPRDSGLAREAAALGDLRRQPRLEQVPAIREGGLVALLALHEPEALLELGHRALERARLAGLEHEDVRAQLARVLRVLVEHRVHDPAGRVRQPPRLVLDLVVARPLTPADERVEHREQIERDQERAPLQELAVVHALARRQRVFETPREADAGVVVRVPGPTRIRLAGHRFPETGHALGEAIEGRAEADVAHERERVALAVDAARRQPAEPALAKAV